MDPVTVIGIDCATQPRKTGVASAVWDGADLRLDSVQLGRRKRADQIAELIPTSGRCLIALDAPLGWPEKMSRLADHRAGEGVGVASGRFFRRRTDSVVNERIGQRPSDVGAERIARTAHAALDLLAELREKTGEAIPLAWGGDFAERVAAIEVYPAATLRSRKIRCNGYKKNTDECRSSRREIIEQVGAEMELSQFRDELASNGDLLDSAICCLAGADFLRGQCISPDDPELTLKESWIWVRDPDVRERQKLSPGESTQIGFRNPNNQTVIEATDRAGTDYNQRVYILECGTCHYRYGANGSDIHLRKCPKCQEGRPGI